MSTNSKPEAHGCGSSHSASLSAQCFILPVNENEHDSIVSNTTDSNAAVATKTPHLPVLPDPPGRLFGPYPSRAARTCHSRSRASPYSSTTTTSTEGFRPELPNALNVPHPASISTVCLSGPLVEKIHAISEAGFNSVEIYENDLVNFWGQLSEIRELCYKLGLGIGSMRTEEGLEGLAGPLNGVGVGVAKALRLRER